MDVSTLPIMKACCKTCPFKKQSDGTMLNAKLAGVVIGRNLFQSQQIFVMVQKDQKREPKNRCKGYYDYSFQIYERMGLDPENNIIK